MDGIENAMMSNGLRINELRQAEQLYKKVFGGLDELHGEVVRMTLEFFKRVSDMHREFSEATVSKNDYEKNTKFMTAGTYATTARQIISDINEYLMEKKVTTCMGGTTTLLQSTKDWLEKMGWMLCPRDFGTSNMKDTMDGIIADIRAIEKYGDSVREMIYQKYIKK